MAEEIAVGDVVRLKSGGPKMTVTAIDKTQFSDDLSVWCEWFDEKNKPETGTFSLTSVQKWPPPGEPKVVRRNPDGSSWMG